MLNHNDFKEKTISGRYINPKVLSSLFREVDYEVIGYSNNKKPIKVFKLGQGKTKVLAWSQMHGNETTTTKALVDLINFLRSGHLSSLSILNTVQFHAILQLNPDGSEMYTRVNSLKIDLNRDAKNLTQPESKALRAYLEYFCPDFCFNLHDQRTIFNTITSKYPAVISFLSPSANNLKTLTPPRVKAMKVIAQINKTLQQLIPNRLGRYDDSFNINCTGDMFTFLNIPVILFEAGQFDCNDYNREASRFYMFTSIYKALFIISKGLDTLENDFMTYFNIPENKKKRVDICVQKTFYNQQSCDVGLLFEEKLIGHKVLFYPRIVKIGDLSSYEGFFNYNSISIKEALYRASKLVKELIIDEELQ